LLDFELEEVSSSREVKLSNQWGQSAAVGEDIVEVIGAVGAQFNGFLQSLSDRLPSVDIHQQVDPANVTHGVKFPLTQSAVVGLGFWAQGQEASQ
jgi:hypothetical protein